MLRKVEHLAKVEPQLVRTAVCKTARVGACKVHVLDPAMCVAVVVYVCLRLCMVVCGWG